MAQGHSTVTWIQDTNRAVTPSRIHGTGLQKEPVQSRAATVDEAEDLSDNTSDSSSESMGDNSIDDPVQHLQWANTLPTPLKPDSNQLSQRQKQNLVDMMTNPNEYRGKVIQKLQDWTQRKLQLAGANEAYRNTLDATQQATLGKIDVLLLQELIEKTNHADKQYVEDLKVGFPVTGRISSGNLGIKIEGGQRVNAKPGLGGPKPLERLKQQCWERNMTTLAAAEARAAQQVHDTDLLWKSWDKLQQDIARGVAGPPQEIHAINLEEQ